METPPITMNKNICNHHLKILHVIVKIDRQLFGKYDIKEYAVMEYLEKFPEDIAAPEDDEIILVKEDDGPFPKKIIKEVIKIAV